MKPTRCCVQTLKGTRCANEPSPVRSTRMIGPVEIAACGLDGHQRAMRSLPDFVRHDAYCGAVGCDQASNAGICKKHRDMYRDFGITEHMLLAQEAPMTEPAPAAPPVTPYDVLDATAKVWFAMPQEERDACLVAISVATISTGDSAPTPPAAPQDAAGGVTTQSGGYLACITPGCGDEDLMDLDQTTGLCGMCSRQKERESKERDYEDNYVPVSEPVPAEARLPPIFQPLDPGIAPVVDLLRAEGLSTPGCGDGYSKKEAIEAGEALDYAHVFIQVPEGERVEDIIANAKAIPWAGYGYQVPTVELLARPDCHTAANDPDIVAVHWPVGQLHTPKPPAKVTEADFEPLHPLEARRASLIARLYMAGFAKVDGPAEYLWRFNGPNGAVLIPVGHPCEVERDFADMLDHAEKECAKVEAAATPADAVEPSAADVDDAYSGRWGQYTAPVQPMSPELAALAARGQEPTAPGPTVAELQQQLAIVTAERRLLREEVMAETARADLLDAEAVSQRQRADAAEEQLRAIAALLDPEDSPTHDADDQPIPFPVRVQTALMPDTAYERELRKSLHAVEAELFEVDRTLQHLGAYGNGPTIDRLLKVLTPGDRRNILELQAAEARMDLARLKARRLSPPPPGRLEEYAAKVAAIEAKIAALPSLPPSTTPLADDLRDLVGRIRCECHGEEAAAVCAELLTVAETLARMEVR